MGHIIMAPFLFARAFERADKASQILKKNRKTRLKKIIHGKWI